MKTNLAQQLACAAMLLLFNPACRKEAPAENLSTPAFVEYRIPAGAHYALNNNLKSVTTAQQSFLVRFDSSCIYQTTDPENQDDINKLYGFSDNKAFHQDFSARFGWRWSEGALRLFAYTYNNSRRESKELATVAIGETVKCRIEVQGDSYRFWVNEKAATMPRQSTTPVAEGYQLYPYFGGDEAAPHDVRIWIREE